MSILSGNKNNGKKGNKNAKGNTSASKLNMPKPGNAGGFSKKPVKTGGTRGS